MAASYNKLKWAAVPKPGVSAVWKGAECEHYNNYSLDVTQAFMAEPGDLNREHYCNGQLTCCPLAKKRGENRKEDRREIIEKKMRKDEWNEIKMKNENRQEEKRWV